MKKDIHRIVYAVGITALLLIAYLMDELSGIPENAAILALMWATRNVIHISLPIGWCASLQQRIINVRIRCCLISVGVLMIVWLTAKIIKWQFVPDRMFWLGRYLWYSYYIPMILIPLLGIFIIDHMGKPEGYRNPRWMTALYIPAFAILIGIFTNDLHEWAFSFPEGIELFDYTYGYGPIYFAAMAWFVLGGIYVVFMLLKKSRVPGSRKMQKLPAIIMGGAVVFWTLYCFDIVRGCDLTVVDCLIISLLMESAIQSGLIASNTNYHTLFNSSTIAAQIVDSDYNPCYTSSSAISLTQDEMKKIGKQPVRSQNTILHAKPIKAGHVLWQDDVTELNALMTRLKDAQDKLGRKNELLQAELKLKEQQAQLEEKSRLYDQITGEAAPQIEKIEALLEKASDPLLTHSVLSQMCVIGSYVKRRSNLLLLGKESPTVHARELEYCIRESLDNLQLSSVSVMLDADCEGELRLAAILCAYDYYENLVEKMLERLTALMVRISCKNGILRMKLSLGCTSMIEQSELESIPLREGSFSCALQDEDAVIELEIPKGGERG